MLRQLKYFALFLFFAGLLKLFQVTLFDTAHYEKLIKDSESPKVSRKPIKKRIPQPSSSPAKADPPKATANTAPLATPSTQKEGPTNTDEWETSSDGDALEDVLASLKNEYLAPIVAEIPEGDLRDDVVVRYYRHKKDLDRVDKLKALAYYVHERKARQTLGQESNVIYYGDDVPLEDIQIIALTLLKEGVPLKSIEHTRYAWKARSVEIGADPDLMSAPLITVREIQNFQKN